MSSSDQYDIIIIGAGLAGLHLALGLKDEPYFDDWQILMIDPEPKETNDKTWCFWEVGDGKWDHLLYHTWSKGCFCNDDDVINMDMGGYKYKMIKSIDFYRYARGQLNEVNHINWIQDKVEKVDRSGETFTVTASKSSYSTKLVFDSRISNRFDSSDDKYIRILQHFKGWRIRTESAHFDKESFTMMDFRVKSEGKTCFTYVLPFSANEALVEFTLFTPSLLKGEEYDTKLEEYIEKVLGIQEYQISETEFGVIPMTDYPFHSDSHSGHNKIGTAGGWVKPSSGYSFKNAERKTDQIISNLLSDQPISQDLHNPRFRWYDSIFLRVLYENNHLGESVFSDMYIKNKAWRIFRFLDEDSSLSEDIKIISSFEKLPFIRAFLKNLMS